MTLDFKTMMKSMDPHAKVRFVDDPPKFDNFFIAVDEWHAQRMKVPHTTACPICVKNYESMEEPERVPYGKSMGFVLNAMKPRDPAEYVTITEPRKHRQRSNQTEAYHRKVQKRWDKRGLKVTKLQEVMDPILVKLSNASMAKLRRQLEDRSPSIKIDGPDLHIDLDRAGLVFAKKPNA